MSEIILGRNFKYKWSFSQNHLTLNVGYYLFPKKDNSTVTLNVKYDFEQINIAKMSFNIHLS